MLILSDFSTAPLSPVKERENKLWSFLFTESPFGDMGRSLAEDQPCELFHFLQSKLCIKGLRYDIV